MTQKKKSYDEKSCTIYKLCFNTTSKVYIGSTLSFNRRLSEHIKMLRKGKHHSQKLQRYVNKAKEMPSVVVLETCTEQERQEREQFWINHYNSMLHGFNCVPAELVLSNKERERLLADKQEKEFILVRDKLLSNDSFKEAYSNLFKLLLKYGLIRRKDISCITFGIFEKYTKNSAASLENIIRSMNESMFLLEECFEKFFKTEESDAQGFHLYVNSCFNGTAIYAVKKHKPCSDLFYEVFLKELDRCNKYKNIKYLGRMLKEDFTKNVLS